MLARILAIVQMVWLKTLRRKDVYVLLVLMGAMLAGVVSLDVFGLGGFVRYATDVGLLLCWLFSIVLTVPMAAREIPEEERSGGALALLSKPLRRWEFVVGKWLGAWTSVCAATALLYGGVIAMTALMGGALRLDTLAQGVALHAVALAILGAIAVALSTRLNADAAAALAYVSAATSFMVLPRVPAFVLDDPGEPGRSVMLLLYHALPHFDFFDLRLRIVHDFDPLSAGLFFQVLAYGAVFTALFLMLAWLGFRHKRFCRGVRL